MKKILISAALALFAVLSLSSSADEKRACCKAKAGATAAKMDAKCPMEATAAKAGMKCDEASKTEVSLTGKVLCEHCDLHKAEKCNPVFQAEGRTDTLSFCPETKDVAAMKTACEGGKDLLEVRGHICKTKDGKEMLMVTSFAKKAEAKKA